MLEGNFGYALLRRVYGNYPENLDTMLICLNCYFDSHVLESLDYVSNNSGISGDYIGFFFPSFFDPWEEDYFEEGVMFQFGPGGVIVDNSTFYKYLKMAVNEATRKYPELKTEADRYMTEIKIQYSCLDNQPDKIIKILDFSSDFH